MLSEELRLEHDRASIVLDQRSAQTDDRAEDSGTDADDRAPLLEIVLADGILSVSGVVDSAVTTPILVKVTSPDGHVETFRFPVSDGAFEGMISHPDDSSLVEVSVNGELVEKSFIR